MKAALRDIAETLILTALIFVVVQSIVKNYRVEGTSMMPTLHNNEFLLVDRAVYWSLSPSLVHEFLPSVKPTGDTGRVYLFHPPKRGNIIVFQFPKDPSREFIKRVIGVPGDTVAIHNGHVYINNRALNEPYIMAPPNYVMPATYVPTGEYFVLGDNRNDSSDSHIWGMVPWYYIDGEAWVSYWPLGDWQFFSTSAMASPRS